MVSKGSCDACDTTFLNISKLKTDILTWQNGSAYLWCRVL